MKNLQLRFELINNFNVGQHIRTEHIDTVMVANGFSLIGQGRHRRTYLSPNKRYVLKFPICKGAVESNRTEHDTWHKYKSSSDMDEIIYAPCRMINNTILMMWACSGTFGNSSGCEDAIANGKLAMLEYDEQPAWAYHIDCCQVGRLRNGKLVAYDYE